MHFIGDSFLSLSFPIWWYLERSCLAKSLYLNTSTRLYFVSSRGNRSRYRGAGHRKQRGTKGPITRTVMLLPRKQPTDCVCSPLQRFRGSRIRPFDVGESIRHVAIRYVHKKKKKKKKRYKSNWRNNVRYKRTGVFLLVEFILVEPGAECETNHRWLDNPRGGENGSNNNNAGE